MRDLLILARRRWFSIVPFFHILPPLRDAFGVALKEFTTEAYSTCPLDAIGLCRSGQRPAMDASFRLSELEFAVQAEMRSCGNGASCEGAAEQESFNGAKWTA